MRFYIDSNMTKGLHLSGAELLVYAFLCSEEYSGENINTWYEECGAGTLTTIRRALKSLEEKELIVAERDSVTSPMKYSIVWQEGNSSVSHNRTPIFKRDKKREEERKQRGFDPRKYLHNEETNEDRIDRLFREAEEAGGYYDED